MVTSSSSRRAVNALRSALDQRQERLKRVMRLTGRNTTRYNHAVAVTLTADPTSNRFKAALGVVKSRRSSLMHTLEAVAALSR